MFYVKETINDTVEIAVEIHDDNVYCTCPGCGREVCVDLTPLLSDGDLYSTTLYCSACSKARLEDIR